MKRNFLCLLVGILLALPVVAALPLQLPYQGQLSTNGVLITATQVFSFAIYTNNATAWQSGASVTTYVERGFFSVALGRPPQTLLPGALFDGTLDLYLEVAVAPPGSALTTLAPRKNLRSAAAAVDTDRLAGLRGSAYMKRWTNVVIVGPGGLAGGADTNTLAAGIALAGGKASAQNPYTVLLLPGSYAGAISTANVAIVGVARDACAITSTLTILDSIDVRDVRVSLSTMAPAVDIHDCSPYLNNLRINGGLYGVRIWGTGRPTLVNLEVYGLTNAAVRDESGATIDGLRVYNRAAFDVDGATLVAYNNIMASGERDRLGRLHNVTGKITGLRGTRLLEIDKAQTLVVQDVDIVCAHTGMALRIGEVSESLEIKDGVLAAMADTCVSVSNTAAGWIRFNDVRLMADSGRTVAVIATAPRVDFKECELISPVDGTSVGIHCATGDFLYVQTCWVLAGNAGIVLAASNTAAYVYDTTIRTDTGMGANAIRHQAGTQSVAPRIADCRFETDTSPSQNSGIPGWNMFGGAGAVGGQEDRNGNIVAPGSGRPVSP